MRIFTVNSVFIICLLTILFAGGIPAQSGAVWSNDLGYIECVADGNNTHTTATLINRSAMIYDTVCEADPHDWYMLPLQGDLKWNGVLTCFADGPGLRVGLYVDTGAGPLLIVEDSPVLTPIDGTEVYMLEWDLLDLAAGLGHTAAQPGNYYIRVTYYTYHPGNHPYSIWLNMTPEEYDASPYNSPATARPLPPGILHYGHMDASDPSDWFTFTIEPGQSGTGVIFGEDVYTHSGGILIKSEGGHGNGEPVLILEQTIYSLQLYSSDLTWLGSKMIPRLRHGALDLKDVGMLAPGTYYIEVTCDTPSVDPDWEAYYKVFNHALAPNTGVWTEDMNFDMGSAAPFTEGVPVSGSVWSPRDDIDYFSFTSPGYFLGDVVIEPSLDFMYVHATFLNDEGYSVGGHWIPGLGISCRNGPRLPADFYFVIKDRYRMFTPTDYTVTYYHHGVPMTEPMGHDTWQTAQDLMPVGSGELYFYGESASIDFYPGIQDVYYAMLTVPADNLLVGYYNIYGSRTDYRVRLGKLGPGGNPVWSPAMLPTSMGTLHIDLSYAFLSDAGTYFIKVEMLPTSPGRMRLYIANHSKIAACEPDENNTYTEAWNLLSYKAGSIYKISGTLCPIEDDVDWFYFDSGYFDDTYGPKKNLLLQGAAAGMRYELYDGSLTFLADGEITEMGGSAMIDLDGLIVPIWTYYIKIIANPAEDRVQVYELKLRNDLLLTLPMIDMQFLKEIRYPLLRHKIDLPSD